MDEILELIKQTIEDNISLSKPIVIGRLGTGESIALQVAPSNTDMTFMDKGITYDFDLLFLMKSKDQVKCFTTLSEIGMFLIRLKDYPNTNDINWVNSIITTGPVYVDIEDSKEWIYSMVISNKLEM